VVFAALSCYTPAIQLVTTDHDEMWGWMMKRTWTADELLEHFTLSPADVATVGNTTIHECRRANEAELIDWLCTQILDHE
jgi:predicted Rdx family selenoprotein